MEEPSPFTVATTNQWGEIPDSNSSSHHLPIKHPTSSAGVLVSASKFKGVVSQPNGHWGAQIYANHQRIWLGTFKSENEAAMAYDSAAIKLRNGFTNRNFQWTDITVREPSFQDQFSTETVLTMIKDGSYASKFSDYLRAQDRQGLRLSTLQDAPGTRLRQLFQKELTPSDVSKLNRLVIPKKYALKYFPRISDVKERNGGNVDDIELVFFDRSMRSWNFRYCYWKSSQSFVFTRGWNRFAKEKGLRSRDRVIFSSYECSGQKLCILDVAYDDRDRSGPIVESNNDDDETLQVKMGPRDEIEGMDVEGYAGMNEEEGSRGEMKDNVKGLKLFGVQII
ncbi:hypothetical protein C2S53_012917 [Perilla frutescens var. hirtella]|uniref:Uncharacterized protein n=1 Tax=Perilla frutescens var. hirtella TaxID=608512 RepID=A0AAD4J8X8_PERFH|nr:hypothetical protein C2S53_012917 [Perilla frutescens var. hirtella]